MIQVQGAAAQYGGLSQNGGNGTCGSGFTLKHLLNKLEDHFPTLLSGEGGLGSDAEPRSDRLLSTYDNTHLETPGPPDGLKGVL